MTLRHKIARSIMHDFIENGVVKPGGKLPSLRQLVQKYGSSPGTIGGAVLMLESQGLVRSQHGSGCYVAIGSNAATSSNNKKKIGVIVSLLNQGYVLTSRILAGVDESCREMGFDLVTAAPNEWNYEVEKCEIERLREAGCLGVVLPPSSRNKNELRHDHLEFENLDYPIVLIDPPFYTEKRSQVVFDNFSAGLEMTNHLLKNGHERIAFMVATIPGTSGICSLAISERLRGYKTALRLCGKSMHPGDKWEFEEDLQEFGVRHIAGFIRDWKNAKDRPTALIAVEDGHAVTTITVAREMGIAIPQDLEVTGFDNLPLARQTRPHISTTNPNGIEAGRQAVRLVYQHIMGEMDRPRTLMLPVPVLTRDTISLDDLLASSDVELSPENHYLGRNELNALK